jgi:methyl-accepting chemotaxis protein
MRLMAGPVIAVGVVLGICAVNLLTLSQQRGTVTEITKHEIGRSATVTQFLTMLSGNQTALATLLTGAVNGKLNEEQIFEQGRKTMDKVRELSKQFAGYRPLFAADGALLEVYEIAEKEMTSYRGTVVSAVQMATVDADMASGLQSRAAGSYILLVDQMSKVLERTDAKIAAELDGMLAASGRTTTKLAVGAMAALVGLLALCFLFYRNIAATIRAIVTVMERLSRDETDVDVPNQERKDEIGAIARSVQVFKENAAEMRRLQAEQREAEHRQIEEERQREREKAAAERSAAEALQQRAEKQRERAEKIDALIESFNGEAADALDAVSHAASEIRTLAEAMAQSAEDTSGQSSSVAAASEQAADNVRSVATAAEELASSVHEIGRQVEESARITRNTATSARETDSKVQGLADAASKIGEVVNLINDIASQTNLLALNATIEAARAGDAGKGFAVVASEVKSLANQTARATEEIAGQIGAIQDATGTAVQAIQEIASTIEQIDEIAAGISSAVEQQGASTREIAGNVQQMAAAAGDITGRIGSVNAAAAESGEAATRVHRSAEDMVQRGETLRSRIAEFIDAVRAA